MSRKGSADEHNVKQIILPSILVLAIYSFAYAQVPLTGFDRLKQIRLLKSDAFQVKQILWDFAAEEPNDDDHSQKFSTKEMSVEVTYSSGVCSEDEDDDEGQIWDVPEWIATDIRIEPNDPVKVEDLHFDLSKLKKEQIWANNTDSFVYHNKELGIALRVSENEIDAIYLFAPQKSKPYLCENKNAKRFVSKSWFGNTRLEDRKIIGYSPASVTALILSATEFDFIDANKEVKVETIAGDPDNDILTYNYTVTGGKVIGEGSKVIWSLKAVLPGTYSITAGVDDGCGICGKTITRSVTIK